jgi:heme-degrading monooxygenase HmoA
MFAIAVSAQVQLDKIDEAASIFRESVVPAYKQLNGFKSAHLLIDPATGKSLGISLWESEADRAAVQSSGALQQQLAKFAAVLAAQPVPSTYEVKVQV